MKRGNMNCVLSYPPAVDSTVLVHLRAAVTLSMEINHVRRSYAGLFLPQEVALRVAG